MTYNGAAGTTQEVMQRALQLEGLTVDQINDSYKSLIALLRGLDSRVQFRLANSIWYRQGFVVKPPFLDVNKRYFDATVSALDFDSPSAPDTINQWVKDKTSGRIDKMVETIDPMTMMFLLNAIYFKASWTHQFEKNKTQKRSLHIAGRHDQVRSHHVLARSTISRVSSTTLFGP